MLDVDLDSKGNLGVRHGFKLDENAAAAASQTSWTRWRRFILSKQTPRADNHLPFPWQASLSPRTAQLSLARPTRLFQSSPALRNPHVTFNGQKSFALRTIENRERDRFDETNRQHFLPNNPRSTRKKLNSLQKAPTPLKFPPFRGVGRSKPLRTLARRASEGSSSSERQPDAPVLKLRTLHGSPKRQRGTRQTRHSSRSSEVSVPPKFEPFETSPHDRRSLPSRVFNQPKSRHLSHQKNINPIGIYPTRLDQHDDLSDPANPCGQSGSKRKQPPECTSPLAKLSHQPGQGLKLRNGATRSTESALPLSNLADESNERPSGSIGHFLNDCSDS